MSLPIMGSMLIQALYNIVDSIFVSRISEDALAAVSMAFPLQNLLISTAVGTAVGMNALLSRSLGQKKFEKANRTGEHGLILGILTSFLFVLFGIFGTRFFYETQTNSEMIIQHGVEYLRIVSLFCVGIYIQITSERLLQSTGKAFYSMITQSIGAIINIILDPILIFGLLGFPKFGVAGAAYATVIGQFCGAGTGIYLNHKVNHDIQLSFKGFQWDWKLIREMYAVGLPSILMMSIASFSTYFINKIVGVFTSTAVAAFGIFVKIQSFVLMPLFGMTNGIVSIIAYNYGAGKTDRLKETMRLGLVVGSIMTITGCVVLLIGAPSILRAFDAGKEMMDIGLVALRRISISFILAGASIVCSAIFQALGNGVLSMFISFVRQLIVLVPLAYLLSLTHNLDAVWFAFPIAEVICLALCIYFLKKVVKKEVDNNPNLKYEKVAE